MGLGLSVALFSYRLLEKDAFKTCTASLVIDGKEGQKGLDPLISEVRVYRVLDKRQRDDNKKKLPSLKLLNTLNIMKLGVRNSVFLGDSQQIQKITSKGLKCWNRQGKQSFEPLTSLYLVYLAASGFLTGGRGIGGKEENRPTTLFFFGGGGNATTIRI